MNGPIDPPDPGYLLRELGYDDEPEAAASLDITPQTLTGYRKAGIGPRYVELARKIYYSKEARAEWLAAGGTRSADENCKGAPRIEPVQPAPSRPKPEAAKRRVLHTANDAGTHESI